MAIFEKQLAQVRPSDTSNTTMYTPPASTTAIVKSLVICNLQSGAVTYRVFMDKNGSTFDDDSTLIDDNDLASQGVVILDVYWPMEEGDTLGVRSSSGGDINFVAFGAELT